MEQRPLNVEWELDAEGNRTGRWRRRQFYRRPGPEGLAPRDRRPPSERAPCEWRTGVPK